MSKRPGVVVNSKSGNTPCTTIDLRIHIGNDTREDIMIALDEAYAEFKTSVHARLDEIAPTSVPEVPTSATRFLADTLPALPPLGKQTRAQSEAST